MINDTQKALEELPPVLNVEHIKDFLNISKSKSYELVSSGEFHVVKIGRLFKVPKDSFSKWFLGQQQQG